MSAGDRVWRLRDGGDAPTVARGRRVSRWATQAPMAQQRITFRCTAAGNAARARPSPCRPQSVLRILNRMVQYTRARLDASFAALSDATRRGVLEQLGRADASITELAEKFHRKRLSSIP